VPDNRPPPPNLIKPTINKLTLTREGQILWNGTPQTGSQLVTDLKATLAMNPEPELQFEPDQDASYDLSAKVLNIIKGSKVTKFGFVHNELYSEFDKAAGAK
jgi:biopolymer transport protein ExbD